MSRPPLYKLVPITTDETLGERIRRIRSAKGLTQIEVAQKIGITQSLYSSYERGRLRLSAEMVAQVALVLNASSDEILGLERLPTQSKVDRALLRRMERIDSLPPRKRKLLFSNIDMLLRGVLAPGLSEHGLPRLRGQARD